jgi:hypothetical protein
MDRRRIALQIQAILLPYRVERRRRNSRVMEQFRERARVLLDDLDDSAGTDAELRQALSDARRELESDDV